MRPRGSNGRFSHKDECCSEPSAWFGQRDGRGNGVGMDMDGFYSTRLAGLYQRYKLVQMEFKVQLDPKACAFPREEYGPMMMPAILVFCYCRWNI